MFTELMELVNARDELVTAIDAGYVVALPGELEELNARIARAVRLVACYRTTKHKGLLLCLGVC